MREPLIVGRRRIRFPRFSYHHFIVAEGTRRHISKPMNPILHKILLFALFLNVATWANAAEYDFSVDGFEYKKLSETEVEVSGYSGDKTIITIREWIISGGEKYQVIKIGDEAFRNRKITHVTIYGVKDIGKYAFQNCTELISIAIPETVKSVGAGAFDECRKLS